MIQLTDRELAVLEHAADGSTNVEIGRALIVSPETVKTYKRQLFEKLEARNTTHAVAIAFRQGVLKVTALAASTLDLPVGDWAVNGTIKDGRLLLAFEPTEKDT